jgi:hypothetical protein
MKRKPENRRSEVVLLGDFNPKIFSPAWFAAQELIGEKESEAIEPEIIHTDVTILNFPWCRLQCTRERFSIFTEQEAYFEILRDLVASAFQLLEHTPVPVFGYNWSMDFKCDSEDEWHSLGHYLLPQDPWRGVFKDSGMYRVEVVEKNPPDDSLDGSKRIRVEPSKRIKPGVYFNINDHYGISSRKEVVGCKTIITKFVENWEKSKKESEKAIKKIFDNFLESNRNEPS